MSRVLASLVAVAAWVCVCQVAWAHYLWVSIQTDASGKSIANVYFEEGPAAGTGEYLDPIIRTSKTWIRTVASPEPVLIATQDTTEGKNRWLSAEIPQSAPRSLDSYGKFGVYRYGQTDVLLHYYARYLDVTSHEDLHELARAESLRLDIVPHDEPDGIRLKVLWEGEPAAKRTVYVRGPKGFRQNLTTDDQGVVKIVGGEAGRYLFRTFIELNEAGRDGDQDYALIRHHATLAMNLPLKD